MADPELATSLGGLRRPAGPANEPPAHAGTNPDANETKAEMLFARFCAQVRVRGMSKREAFLSTLSHVPTYTPQMDMMKVHGDESNNSELGLPG